MKILATRHLILVMASLMLLNPVFGQSGSDKIDADLEQCLAQKGNDTTAGMRNCVGTAYQRMDHRLNEVYSLLMKRLSPENREMLKDAQRKWLAFRDAELKLAKSTNPDAGGTIALVTDDNDAYEILKKRTIDLERLLRQTE